MATATVDDLANVLMAGKVPERDRSFAQSLVAQGQQRGLSEKQQHWVGVLVNQALGVKPTAVVGDFSGVYDLFQRAAKHLKYPKVTLLTDDGVPLQLYVSGPRSKMPGVVNIRDASTAEERAYDDAVWYGRVTSDGTWHQSGRLTEDQKPRLKLIAKLLKEFAKNPEEIAAEYGKLTGNCCFCSRALEDERSTEVGYGPVCAKRYGLKWGKR